MFKFTTILLVYLSMHLSVYSEQQISKDSLLKVQETLLVLGYEPGTPDGISGAKTVDAIKKFQSDNNLKVDGILSDETLKALFPPEKPEPETLVVEGKNILDTEKALINQVLIVLIFFILTLVLLRIRGKNKKMVIKRSYNSKTDPKKDIVIKGFEKQLIKAHKLHQKQKIEKALTLYESVVKQLEQIK